MANKICWIDEDERIWSPERKLLLGIGFTVETHNNASDALTDLALRDPDTYRLLILDVMLRQGDNLDVFSDHRTQRGLDTGIILAEELIGCNQAWRSKILLFSRANKPDHVDRIRSAAGTLEITYLRKERANQGKNFVQRLKDSNFITG